MRLLRNRAAVAGAMLVAALVSSAAPRQARAYCRTVTAALPAGYDPSAGCYAPATDGRGNASKFLYWRASCVGFSLQQDASRQVSLAQATSVVEAAFETWSSAGCEGGQPSIRAVDNGAVACAEVGYAKYDANQNVIVFRDDAWRHSDPNNTLALTTVTFDRTNGELLDADMEINSAQTIIVAGGTIPLGAYDLQTLVTHEAGHFLGLAHSADPSAVMYARYKASETTLAPDDVQGICAIYPANDTRVTSAGALEASVCDAVPRNGFSTACGDFDADAPPPQQGCAVGGPLDRGASGPSSVIAAAFGLGGLALGVRRWRRRRCTLRTTMRPTATIAPLALLLSVAGASAASFVARDASASVSIAVLFDELLAQSTGAGIATPLEERAVWEDGRIYTYTRVRFDTKVAGDLQDEAWVRTMGGAVGNIGQATEGEASLVLGQPALLFVQSGPAGTLHVTARAQGMFPVKADASSVATSSRGASGKVVPRLARADHPGMLLPPTADRVTKLAAQLGGGQTSGKLATDLLHGHTVAEASDTIARAWSRLHPH